jgi:hypothetical protein
MLPYFSKFFKKKVALSKVKERPVKWRHEESNLAFFAMGEV